MSDEPKTPENANNPMSYVTQGTVQIERKSEIEADIIINPTQDYAVKHNEREYIVFVKVKEDSEDSKDEEPPSIASKLFEKRKPFPTEKYLIEMLTKAAVERTRVEITINAHDTITALKIPAMPDRTQHGATA
jgi:hypothetical protein